MPYLLKKYYPYRNLLFFFGEGFLIFLTISTVYLVAKGPTVYFDGLILYCLRACVVTVTFQLCLYYFDLYDLSTIPRFSDTATRVTQAFGFGCIALALLYLLFPVIIISMEIFWMGYGAICLMIALWRFSYTLVLSHRLFTQPLLVYGTGMLAGRIAREIEGKEDCGFRIVVYAGAELSSLDHQGVPVYGIDENLLELCRRHAVEKIIVALDDKRGQMPIRELLRCKLEGMPILLGINFYEELTGKILVEKVNPSWVIFSSGFFLGRLHRLIKRVMDISLALPGLLLSSPVSLLSALIIKLESSGPVFYTQDRVGRKGRIYKVIKFRSMRQDAEKDGPVWAQQNDSRTTRYGSLMRKTRIDEIPQMWNILRGDMSFVGPRPERPVFVKELEKKIPYYSLRHNVKPGLTGWAQVLYPYGASDEDALRKLEYDLYYIKNFSPFMDIWIIFETVKTVLFQKGSR